MTRHNESMKAEIISVGTELLLGATVDTNAARLGEVLARCGITCTHRQTVGDNLERLTDSLREALSRAEIVVLIGGLGPTQDDLTRDGIAAATGCSLQRNEEIERNLRSFFEQRNLKFVESNARQAMVPEGAEALANANGTAPGIWLATESNIVIALPGPPREFIPLLIDVVKPRLQQLNPGQIIHSRTLRLCGIGESAAEAMITDLLSGSNPTVAPYAKIFEVHFRVTSLAASQAEAEDKITPTLAILAERFHDYLYGTDDQSLESVVLDLLRTHSKTLATAESLTGGLLSQRITSVPGSSDAYLGGVVCYSEALKQSLVGVPAAILSKHTAVSSETAAAMARGIRQVTGADFGIALTGVAGPGADSNGHAEGLVYIGLSHGDEVEVKEHHLGRGREAIRERAAQHALAMIWRALRA